MHFGSRITGAAHSDGEGLPVFPRGGEPGIVGIPQALKTLVSNLETARLERFRQQLVPFPRPAVAAKTPALLLLNLRPRISSRIPAKAERMPAFTVGEPTRIAFERNTSVIVSFLSDLLTLWSLTSVEGEASVMPFAISSASLLVPPHIES